MRGEQESYRCFIGASPGSPPRARGAAEPAGIRPAGQGITPACAGSSHVCRDFVVIHGDHPRVRGEQRSRTRRRRPREGSPPRARGAEAGPPRGGDQVGITPACAGSRGTFVYACRRRQDHPRVRGEQFAEVAGMSADEGSPPRARGAGREGPRLPYMLRITPACAGSSSPARSRRSWPGDHPRVRGEQAARQRRRRWGRGSPPRARGAAVGAAVHVPRPGITPACAGSRHSCCQPSGQQWDHPRVRGEQGGPRSCVRPSRGSPPRARGAVAGVGSVSLGHGITPACAGSSDHHRSDR